ncbi:MAG: hypothetical protein GY917_27030, partial [Planctomycetaceae bacterium]|nr:hypothetical protein [Planctomycetaceae bacterium]
MTLTTWKRYHCKSWRQRLGQSFTGISLTGVFVLSLVTPASSCQQSTPDQVTSSARTSTRRPGRLLLRRRSPTIRSQRSRG